MINVWGVTLSLVVIVLAAIFKIGNKKREKIFWKKSLLRRQLTGFVKERRNFKQFKLQAWNAHGGAVQVTKHENTLRDEINFSMLG